MIKLWFLPCQKKFRLLKKTESQEILSEFDSPLEYRPLVADLLNKNKGLFAAKDSDLTFTDTVKFRIDTGDAPPIRLRPYRIRLKNQPIVHKAVDEMLEAGILRRSHSQYSFPVVIVDKKDGTKRFCIDFRVLNKVTKPISWLLPLIDDVLSLLKGAKFFTSLDMKSGYWQVLVHEEDREKTAFSVPGRGLFKCNCLPFGLINAPSVFQSLMSIVLEGLNHFCQAYLDDILIFSTTVEDHLSHIDQVFDLYVNQALMACRFSVNRSTGFSPHYLVYLNDPVVPLDNILMPRNKYMGEKSHLQMLEKQHQIFQSVHQHLKTSRARQKKIC